MSLNLSDEVFLKNYASGFDIVFNSTRGIQCSVLDLELNLICTSKWNSVAGLTEDDLKKILRDPKLLVYRRKALDENKIIKLLSVRTLEKRGANIGVITHTPIVNPETKNVVALHVNVNRLDIFNLSILLASYYKNEDLTLRELKGPVLTEREKQVVFFFLLNLESYTIAEVLSKIENKKITKNSIDQLFFKQLLPKFGVYSRKALYNILNENGYTRFIPQNILNDGLLLDITDYVILY